MDMMRGYRMKSPNRRSRRAGNQPGFSLIEIMVVLIILLIGVLAIVRLFPQGFAAITRTGDMTIGSALAQQQLDNQKNQLSVPDAIVAFNPITLAIDPNRRPDDITDYNPGDAALGGKDPYFWSNVNITRHIIGETFRIPGPSTNALGVYGAVYALQLGPVENALAPGSPNTDSLQVYGAALERTEQSSVPTINQPNPTAVLRNEAQYAIDYNNFMIAFYPRVKNPARAVASRQFILSYDYYTNGGGVIGQNYAPKSNNTVITVPDVDAPPPGYTVQPVWQHIFVNGSDPAGYVGSVMPADFILDPNYGFNHGTEDAGRKFRLASGATVEGGGGQPTWSPDEPYEYAWFSAQDGSNTVNPGILIFNPSGHTQIASTSSGNQSLLARVDYTTFDNHIMRDDRTVPGNGPYTIQLSVPFLQLTGDVLDNQIGYNNFNAGLNPFNGIYRTPGTATYDVLIYNISTGEKVGDWTNGAGTGILTADPVKNPTPVGQKSGTLTLNPDNIAAANLQGASLRIFYRGSKDWGVQIQKATANYLISPTLPLNYNNFYVGGTIAGTGSPTRIYFPRCDAGKTVVLGEYYILWSDGRIDVFRNEAFQLADDPALYDALNLPFLDVSTQHTRAGFTMTGFTATQTGRPVSNVQGVSMKTKVLWRNSNLRWRRVENDTLLNQQPGR
jgi:prepilin-type N-terminal cleavage/methylation domain-containing protein